MKQVRLRKTEILKMVHMDYTGFYDHLLLILIVIFFKFTSKGLTRLNEGLGLIIKYAQWSEGFKMERIGGIS